MSFFIFLYFSFLLFLFHPASSRQPLCHDSERSALLRFKESFPIDCKFAFIYPSAYSKTALWNLEEDMSDCCSWDGVECNEDTGYVIKLDLNSSCLYGPINSTSTLFNLVHLQWLSLADNYFNHSKIPSEIKNLSNLSHLNLSHSYFSGQIPSEILELSKLESLALDRNYDLELQQPGLESLVQKLNNLRVLDLGGVNISSSLPHVLTGSSSLNFLYLANCELKGTILSSLGNFKNLIHLDLSGNNLWGTSLSSLENLTNLAHLEMRDCNLSGQDPASSLSNLTQLTYLDLSQNNFSSPSSFLSWISKNTKLTHLSLSSISNLSGRDLASSLSNLTQLTYLDLSQNYFSIPSSVLSGFSKNTKLTHLDLSNSDSIIGGEIPLRFMNLNQLSGHIPSQLGNLTQLEYLDLSSNKLQGTIPSSLYNLENLAHLDMSGCNFSSLDPDSSLSKKTKLTRLYLSNNNIGGEIPLSLMNLNQLSWLILSNNQLSGHIPSQLSNLTQLEHLDLSMNKLQGTIPSSLYNLANLANLDLSYCNFASLDPDSSQSNLTQLYYLDLSYNNLSIPSSSLSWIGKNTKLTYLFLSNDNISGEIPLSIMNLNQLLELDLSSNQLSGHILSQISNLTQLKSLDLSSNKLQGSIPTSIFELNNLESLYLSSNNLSGTIELQMFLPLKNLGELDISSTRLSFLSNLSVNTGSHKFQGLSLGSCNLRSFPDFLRYQDQLVELDLSSNNISGQIPGWLFNLSLHYLNLSHNLMTGFEQRLDVLPWTSLSYLDLRFNRLQGPLPFPSINTNHYLVSNNKLSGEIPSWMCKLNSLYALDLSNNNLSGKLPKCLGNFSYGLSMLDLQNNKFNGSIPLNFIKGTELKMIDLSNNLLRGKIPRSLVNCTKLEYLDLGNNKINDTFPSWMGSLPKLEVLNLKSNKLHGVIEEPKSDFVFPKLRMIDLSHNRFIDKFPSKYFQCWNAMKFDYKSTVLTYMMKEDGTSEEDWYDYSLIVVNKGIEIEYVKIPNMLTGIWLSSNGFEGEIPATISVLKGLRYLDLSNNNLIGGIPSSLDNLTVLESLVLSNNKLSGKIPHQLVSLTFLAFFNVSYNHLEGPIPQGPQFNTFDYTSYEGNPGLCGQPLSRKCGNSELPRNNDDDEGSESPFAFGWKVVAIGYACGLIIGVVVGHIFCTKKYEWFVKVFGMPLKRMERKRGRRRN